ncbi:ATP-binding cassette domain-containing protein [Loktanella sp. 3ANDIMAR09]|uniref:ATP-binding cassette domain-containing protein n=1 Tax=Loktanella sp. 3ANDIMAR09 TaxID=1225657 RepID=UPI0006FA3E1D|nr:ATP-binding cassette domain-containing protein [Loktanella sp. 3ANDIMAR09]
MTGWGCTVTDLDFARGRAGSGTQFRIRCDGQLDIRYGGGNTNRVPVMGPSGAGKSTLMHLISATTLPQSPKARIAWTFPDGAELAWGHRGPSPDMLGRLRRRYFGFAFQTPHVPEFMTITEALTFALENRGHSRARARDAAHRSLHSAFDGNAQKVARIAASFPGQLSGGERQRTSLLMALVQDPVVLFADEPTGSLDGETRRTIMAMLTDWLTPDRMLIWVTHHDSDPADTGAPRRLVVADGSVRWDTTAGALA